MTYAEEAIGVSRAAARAGLPCVISFTVETDGRLPSGQSLAEAIAQVDAPPPPAFYMINCAHPTHFEAALTGRGSAGSAVCGRTRRRCRTRSSTRRPSSTRAIPPTWAPVTRPALDDLDVVGGCCGTDHRHVAAIAAALAPG